MLKLLPLALKALGPGFSVPSTALATLGTSPPLAGEGAPLSVASLGKPLDTADLIVAVVYSALAVGSALLMPTIWDLGQVSQPSSPPSPIS